METSYCVVSGAVKLVHFFVIGLYCKAVMRESTFKTKFYDFIICHFEFPCQRVGNFEHLPISQLEFNFIRFHLIYSSMYF